MSRLLLGLLAIFICLYCVSCTNRTNVSTLQSGDLIFVSVPLGFDFGISSDSIGRLTSDMSDESQLQCIHVAIVDVAADTVFVIDATAKRGVARYPLDTFLYDFTLYGGHSPRYDVMRMGTPEDGARYVSNAKTYIGRPYDFDFQLDNEAQYCSELVRNAYTLDDGTPRFPLTRVDFSCRTIGHISSSILAVRLHRARAFCLTT